MQKLLTALIGPAIAALVLAAQPGAAEAQSRIKDIVSIEGVRSNQLVGYGLVVGLNGTGDSVRNSPFTRQSLEGMMERQGVNIRGANLNTKNVAAVMVTAELPPFATPGSRLDVSVSAMGDAKSLLGGTLLVPPCKALTAKSTLCRKVRFRPEPFRPRAAPAHRSPAVFPRRAASPRAAWSNARPASTSAPCRWCA